MSDFDYDLRRLSERCVPDEVALTLRQMAEETQGFLAEMEAESIKIVDQFLVRLEQISVDPSLSVLFALLTMSMNDETSTNPNSSISPASFVFGWVSARLLEKRDENRNPM